MPYPHGHDLVSQYLQYGQTKYIIQRVPIAPYTTKAAAAKGARGLFTAIARIAAPSSTIAEYGTLLRIVCLDEYFRRASVSQSSIPLVF